MLKWLAIGWIAYEILKQPGGLFGARVPSPGVVNSPPTGAGYVPPGVSVNPDGTVSYTTSGGSSVTVDPSALTGALKTWWDDWNNPSNSGSDPSSGGNYTPGSDTPYDPNSGYSDPNNGD